jgi:signal transduction histidine kinase
MRIEAVVLLFFATSASIIAFLSWRTNRKIVRQLAKVSEQWEKAESDKASLLRTLSLRETEENERIYRLEHDVKSSLGVILGFSSLLRESVEHDSGTPPVALKNINAIHQAATKILKTIDAAVEAGNSHQARTTS